MSSPLERVIRPIVEGQIRGFLREHPAVVEAVDWYKPRADKATTFVNSLSKRISRDLLSAETRNRIEAALFEQWEAEKSGVAPISAPDVARVGMAAGIANLSDRGIAPATEVARLAVSTGRAASSRDLLPEIQWGAA